MAIEYSSFFRDGKPILIFDNANREAETDMVIPSELVTPEIIRIMRKEAGGLICTTIKEEDAIKIGLPFLDEFYAKYLRNGNQAAYSGDMKYDKNSSFTVTVNHRSTFTGIPDRDRFKTVNELSIFLSRIIQLNGTASQDFFKEFRVPGHVNLLIARNNYFENRKGHTELSSYVVEKAGFTPSATIAEMLSDSGNAMTKEEAMEYAKIKGLTFIEGDLIISGWADEKGHGNRGV
ncbi:MAG: 3,4-dihydroxy-2-butanone-4-phosphate synthase [Thermoplasmataceae archaeon]